MAELTAAAVVDGIGNFPEVAELSRLAAQVAARVGARRGPMSGRLAAAELYGDPGTTDVQPDAVAVLALAEPGKDARRAWIGDCRAWGFDGRRLRQYTTDHSMGEHLRYNGGQRIDREVAYTPTNSSWLTRIEAQFTALRYFPLDGTDHADHREQGSMIRRYIIWRNRHADDQHLREVVTRANVA
ncbi:hypothetical protein MHW47_10060 [Streptomyces sp. OfavH-34-F]|nr:hypothetical protein [Streptomyces sp. OfavH-34-F]